MKKFGMRNSELSEQLTFVGEQRSQAKVSSTFSKVAGVKGAEPPCRSPQRAKLPKLTVKALLQ